MSKRDPVSASGKKFGWFVKSDKGGRHRGRTIASADGTPDITLRVVHGGQAGDGGGRRSRRSRRSIG